MYQTVEKKAKTRLSNTEACLPDKGSRNHGVLIATAFEAATESNKIQCVDK